MINKVSFVGLGLIGGSIAKAIKERFKNITVYAYDKDKDSLKLAVRTRVVDKILDFKDEEFYTADVIFLCAPLSCNKFYLEFFKDSIQEHTILTDVGSVKTPIDKLSMELDLGRSFIGGHPMAGSEKSGFESSFSRLLENAYYILTPSESVSLDKISNFSEFISKLGAIPIVLSSSEHDFITASVSHLPHIIAASLVNLVKNLDKEPFYMKTIAAGGFRDITRIASSDPVMWEQICMENQGNISIILDEFIKSLVKIRCEIDNFDNSSIYNMFSSSKEFRNSLDIRSSGSFPCVYEIFVDLADEVGGIAKVATLLADNGISIKNIGIINNREFQEGALRIEFYKEAEYENGLKVLINNEYKVFER